MIPVNKLKGASEIYVPSPLIASGNRARYCEPVADPGGGKVAIPTNHSKVSAAKQA